MLNFNDTVIRTVVETVDTAQTSINILKTSSLIGITEQIIWDSSPEEQLQLLKNVGACLTLQTIFKINWEVAQEILINTITRN